jgi:outer membrane protein assembly factor BamA
VGYSNQKRPEFARNIFDGRWTYRWSNPRARTQHRLDLIDVSYIRMPWIAKDYQENYLENSILKYNYKDQMIMRMGYGLVFNSTGNTTQSLMGQTKDVTGYTIRIAAEAAGNLQYGIDRLTNMKRNAEGRYLSFGIPFEQYAKLDVDWAGKLRIDYRNVVAMHAAVGVAVPYENSSMMPFQKRYFAGGANGVRGWSVRGLGPGRYAGGGVSDFMNRSGDVKIDLSTELRTKLFWKLNGAFFIDAGNIWTIRSYAEQPGGQFSMRTFYEELGVAYGLGLRFDFDYFILRLDGAMKAVNPARNTTHYSFTEPRLDRDFTFHFAIGYPF